MHDQQSTRRDAAGAAFLEVTRARPPPMWARSKNCLDRPSGDSGSSEQVKQPVPMGKGRLPPFASRKTSERWRRLDTGRHVVTGLLQTFYYKEYSA